MQLAAPNIDRVDAPRAAREQDLGEASRGGADIEADAACRIKAGMIECGLKLEGAARDPRMLARGFEPRIRRDRLRGLAQGDAVGRDKSGRNRGLRSCAALEQAAFDEDDIGALARG